MTVASEYTSNINQEVGQELQQLKARLEQGDRELSRQHMLDVAKVLGDFMVVVGGGLLIIAASVAIAGVTSSGLPVLFGMLTWCAFTTERTIHMISAADRRFAKTAEKQEDWEEEREKLERQIEKLTRASSVVELVTRRSSHGQ